MSNPSDVMQIPPALLFFLTTFANGDKRVIAGLRVLKRSVMGMCLHYWKEKCVACFQLRMHILLSRLKIVEEVDGGDQHDTREKKYINILYKAAQSR